MGRISTAVALVLGAPLLTLAPRLARAGGALDTVTEGAGARSGWYSASMRAATARTKFNAKDARPRNSMLIK